MPGLLPFYLGSRVGLGQGGGNARGPSAVILPGAPTAKDPLRAVTVMVEYSPRRVMGEYIHRYWHPDLDGFVAQEYTDLLRAHDRSIQL